MLQFAPSNILKRKLIIKCYLAISIQSWRFILENDFVLYLEVENTRKNSLLHERRRPTEGSWCQLKNKFISQLGDSIS